MAVTQPAKAWKDSLNLIRNNWNSEVTYGNTVTFVVDKTLEFTFTVNTPTVTPAVGDEYQVDNGGIITKFVLTDVNGTTVKGLSNIEANTSNAFVPLTGNLDRVTGSGDDPLVYTGQTSEIPSYNLINGDIDNPVIFIPNATTTNKHPALNLDAGNGWDVYDFDLALGIGVSNDIVTIVSNEADFLDPKGLTVTTTGLTVAPLNGDIYEIDGIQLAIKVVNGTEIYLVADDQTDDDRVPETGTLNRVTGSGDATITYTAKGTNISVITNTIYTRERMTYNIVSNFAEPLILSKTLDCRAGDVAFNGSGIAVIFYTGGGTLFRSGPYNLVRSRMNIVALAGGTCTDYIGDIVNFGDAGIIDDNVSFVGWTLANSFTGHAIYSGFNTSISNCAQGTIIDGQNLFFVRNNHIVFPGNPFPGFVDLTTAATSVCLGAVTDTNVSIGGDSAIGQTAYDFQGIFANQPGVFITNVQLTPEPITGKIASSGIADSHANFIEISGVSRPVRGELEASTTAGSFKLPNFDLITNYTTVDENADFSTNIYSAENTEKMVDVVPTSTTVYTNTDKRTSFTSTSSDATLNYTGVLPISATVFSGITIQKTFANGKRVQLRIQQIQKEALAIDSILWQSGNIIRATLTTSLSTVDQNRIWTDNRGQIVIAGSSDNDGRFRIETVTSTYIEFTNTARNSAADDEATTSGTADVERTIAESAPEDVKNIAAGINQNDTIDVDPGDKFKLALLAEIQGGNENYLIKSLSLGLNKS